MDGETSWSPLDITRAGVPWCSWVQIRFFSLCTHSPSSLLKAERVSESLHCVNFGFSLVSPRLPQGAVMVQWYLAAVSASRSAGFWGFSGPCRLTQCSPKAQLLNGCH